MKDRALNFILILILSMLVGFISAAAQIGNITHIQLVIHSPYLLGLFVGTFLSSAGLCLLLSFGIARLINLMANLFRKTKKSFSYIIVWMVFILVMLILLSQTSQNYKDTPINRREFLEFCIASAKQNNNYDLLSDSQKNQIINYCANATNQYYVIFNQCMQKQNEPKKCSAEAINY